MTTIKRVLLSIFCVLFLANANAQTAKELFIPTDYQFTWLGIDFSQVKIIGDFSQFGGAGSSSVREIKDKYFPAWNSLIINEPSKFRIKDAFRKNEVLYDIDMITERNAATKLESLEGINPPNYSYEKIAEIVKSYPLEGKNGFGVLFIAESLNKPGEIATFHVVVMNLQTKEILIQQKMQGAPMGIGIRNYWAGAIYDVIKNIESRQYKVWKSKYSKK